MRKFSLLDVLDSTITILAVLQATAADVGDLVDPLEDLFISVLFLLVGKRWRRNLMLLLGVATTVLYNA